MHKYWLPCPISAKASVKRKNALCLMLNQPAQSIARGTLEQQQLPAEFSTGIPLQLLSNRPDVKAAEMSRQQATTTPTAHVQLSIRKSP